MPECLSIEVFFGWLKGPKKRSKVVLRQDMKNIGVDEDKWYNDTVTFREGWRALCGRVAVRSSGGWVNDLPQPEIHCLTCARFFRQESDEKRHKCISECSKPSLDTNGSKAKEA